MVEKNLLENLLFKLLRNSIYTFNKLNLEMFLSYRFLWTLLTGC